MVSVTRYFFIVLNVFHIVVGALIACYGFWLRFASPIREVLESDAASLTVIYISIIFGIFFMLFGFIGSFGDLTRNRPVLLGYLFVNVVVVALEITVIAYAYSQRNDFTSQLQTVWNGVAVVNQNIIQSRFNCCGFLGPSEYNGVYDVSCLQNVTANTPWDVGCFIPLTVWIDNNATLLGIMGGMLLVISFVQAIMSGKLWWDMGKGNSVHDLSSLTIENEKMNRNNEDNDNESDDDGERSRLEMARGNNHKH